ncbi:MAG: uracil-DNA glycosylase [Candidatus Aminicenantes bacterium]|nr:uracil-DNA glycosylase [Candidatus Aminicenantes bacterium]
MDKDPDRNLSEIEERLRFFKDIGADFVFKTKRPPARPDPAASPAPPPGGELPPPSRDIGLVHEEILRCRKCSLAGGRTQAVPGEGNFRTELMFVGEGPGHDEDVQGRPFIGRAGQLLTRIIAAMTYDRADVFITNIVKCRPPDNRVPHRDEVEACAPYLLEQIGAIRPKVIVTLGKSATDFFLPDAIGGMTSIRGRFYTWRGLQVMPTFHPSYLVRSEGNKEIKKMVWDDMRKVMAFLGKK